MKLANRLFLSLAAALLVCLVPQFSSAQNMKTNSSEPPSASSNLNSSSQLSEAREAAQQMVPAEVDLTRTLDARKDQAGSTFEARLQGSVHLKNGTELPNGTTLVGKIAADQMKNGSSHLALRFTEAKLKDGKTIPIEATIVGISGPSESTDAYSSYDGPLPWNGSSTQYDNVGVMSHVDLHSRIGGENSGTLVATGKSDMKLSTGSRMSLALGESSSN